MTDLPVSTCEALVSGRRQMSLVELLRCAFALKQAPLPPVENLTGLVPKEYRPWIPDWLPGTVPSLRKPGRSRFGYIADAVASWLEGIPPEAVRLLAGADFLHVVAAAAEHADFGLRNAERHRNVVERLTVGRREEVIFDVVTWFDPARLAVLPLAYISHHDQSFISRALFLLGTLACESADERLCVVVADRDGVASLADRLGDFSTSGSGFVPATELARVGVRDAGGAPPDDLRMTVLARAETRAELAVFTLAIK